MRLVRGKICVTIDAIDGLGEQTRRNQLEETRGRLEAAGGGGYLERSKSTTFAVNTACQSISAGKYAATYGDTRLYGRPAYVTDLHVVGCTELVQGSHRLHQNFTFCSFLLVG